MKRRDAVFALLALGAASRACLGYGQGKARRIGYLSLRSGPNEFEQAFVRGMRERGHVEGTTYAIDYRWSGGDQQRNKAMAAEIMASSPDVRATTRSVNAAAGTASQARSPAEKASSQSWHDGQRWRCAAISGRRVQSAGTVPGSSAAART